MEEFAKVDHIVESTESGRLAASDYSLPSIFFHAPRGNQSEIQFEPALQDRALIKDLIDQQWRESRNYALPVVLILASVFYFDGWLVGGPFWRFPMFFFTTLFGTIAIMFGLATSCWLVWKACRLTHPNRVYLKDSGFELCGRHGNYWNMPLKFVYWSQIERVLVGSHENGRVGPLKFELYSDGKPTGQSLCLPLAAFGPKNLEKLLSGLRRHLPPDKIDASVIEEWKSFHPRVESNIDYYQPDDPMQPSYTSIWLSVLQNSKARVKSSALEPGTKLQDGTYEIVSKLGGGGQGTVYLAKSNGYGQPHSQIALKEFILPVHAGEDAVRRVAFEVEREASLLSGLNHQQIVRMLDSFVEDWRIYLVQEYLEGDSLQNIVEQKGQLSEDEVVGLGLQMCEVLDYLHRQAPPIVHRDFTPHNLMLCLDGNLRLIDFNVAFQAEFNSGKTVVGKRNYIPPEQFRGQSSQASDIYALGSTLFYLLTGLEPEPLSQSFPMKVREEVREELNQIVGRATALELAERYSSARELANDLEKQMAKAKPEKT
jgi:serine/threonine protein kinase